MARKPPDRQGPIGIFTALERSVAADSECERQIAEDTARREKARDEKIAALRARVPSDLRGRFDVALAADRERRFDEAQMPKCEGCAKPIDVDGTEPYGLDEDGVYLCQPCLDAEKPPAGEAEPANGAEPCTGQGKPADENQAAGPGEQADQTAPPEPEPPTNGDDRGKLRQDHPAHVEPDRSWLDADPEGAPPMAEIERGDQRRVPRR